jgi:hypothetical protein
MRPDPKPKSPVALTRPVARRVARAVKRVEAAWVVPPDQRDGRPRPWQPGVLAAVVTTAIPTGTTDSPSTTGAADIHRWDGTTSAVDPDPTMQGVRICNRFTLSASIAVGKAIAVAWMDGDYFLIAADCP